MGVPELFKRLQSHCTEVDLYEYLRGQRVGLDSMVWLHAFSVVCAEDVVNGRFDRVAGLFCNRIVKLREQGISMYPVFDGGGTEAKAQTGAKRSDYAESKKMTLTGALHTLFSAQSIDSDGIGNEERDNSRDVAAMDHFEKLSSARAKKYLNMSEADLEKKINEISACINSEMIDAVLRGLRGSGIPYLVAPHEADHQLVFLCQHRLVDCVITVDSDFLCHSGVRVIRVLPGGFQTGQAEVYDLHAPSRLKRSCGAKNEQRVEDLNRIVKKARELNSSSGDLEPYCQTASRVCLGYALLAGNDYNKFEGIGPATAFKMLELAVQDAAEKGSDEKDFVCPKSLFRAMEMYTRGSGKENCASNKRRKVSLTLKEEEVVSTLSKSLKAFLEGLVFWPEAGSTLGRRITPMSGTGSMDGVGVEEFLGQCEMDEEKAVLLAVGERCRRTSCARCRDDDSFRHELGEVRDFFRFDSIVPACITYDMIPGSYLKASELDKCTNKQLVFWLQVRNVPVSQVGLDDDKVREKLLANVKAMLALETRFPEDINLTSPDGRCLIEYLVESRRVLTAPPQHDKELHKYLVQSKKWKTDLNFIKGHAPVLTEDVLRNHFAPKCANLSGNAKVLSAGFSRLATYTCLRNFQYLPSFDSLSTEQTVVDGDRLTRPMAFQLDCPRSMMSSSVRVLGVCSTRPPDDGFQLDVVTKINATWCSCPAGRDGLCVHASALWQVVQNLERPAEIKEDSTLTAKQCRWNQPSQASAGDYSSETLLAEIPFGRSDRLRESEYRNCSARSETRGRFGDEFIPGKEKLLVLQESLPIRIQILRKLSTLSKEAVKRAKVNY